jgi:hypothetical protein
LISLWPQNPVRESREDLSEVLESLTIAASMSGHGRGFTHQSGMALLAAKTLVSQGWRKLKRVHSGCDLNPRLMALPLLN